MNTIHKTLSMLSMVAVLAGCASSGGIGGGATDAGAAGTYGTTAGTATTYGTAPPGGLAGQYVGGPTASFEQRVIYFDFDSAEIRAESRPVVEAHARYLATNPAAGIILEGHADEQGTREYNIALGERRADAVRRLMSVFGATTNQMRVVSYGEERPAVAGHDESAYSLNRRVEIVY